MRTLLIALALLPSVAGAATLLGKFPICLSEDLLDQFIQAQVDNDSRGMEWMLEQNLCIRTGAGVEVSFLGSSWGKARVRVYTDSGAVEVWTITENVRR